MNPIVKKEILNSLRQSIIIIEQGNLYKLRELSTHMVQSAAVYQDKDAITAAVIIYSISKIYQDQVDQFVLPHLKHAVTHLEQGKMHDYEDEMKHLLKDFLKKYEKSNLYIQQVLERAQIKKASQMFEHGISLGQVSDALGISLWDVMDYVGKTRIIDEFSYKTDVARKLKITRRMFS